MTHITPDENWIGTLEKAVAHATDGSKFAVRFGNEVTKASDVMARLSAGEMGDDLPILMEAFGCDYDSACDAVFSKNFDLAIDLFAGAIQPGAHSQTVQTTTALRPQH